MSPEERRLECEFVPGPAALVAVRHFVREAAGDFDLRGSDLEALFSVADQLAVSAIMNETSQFRIEVLGVRGSIRVEVGRPSLIPEEASADPNGDKTGLRHRGIQLIDNLARNWGTSPIVGGGTVVWAEIPRLRDLENSQVRSPTREVTSPARG